MCVRAGGHRKRADPSAKSSVCLTRGRRLLPGVLLSEATRRVMSFLASHSGLVDRMSHTAYRMCAVNDHFQSYSGGEKTFADFDLFAKVFFVENACACTLCAMQHESAKVFSAKSSCSSLRESFFPRKFAQRKAWACMRLGDTLCIHGVNITAHPTRTERAKRAQSL